MKKLIMAAAIVCAAVVAQAATIEWTMYESEIMAGNASDIVADGSPIYLILSSYAQTDFAAAFADAKGDMTETLATVGANAIASTTVDAGLFYTESDYMTGAIEAYYVVFAGDKKAYISDIAIADVDPLSAQGNSYLEFGGPTNSGLAAVKTTDYTGGAGWVEAVPEPTSGLMLLLGMGVLALRRRRA